MIIGFILDTDLERQSQAKLHFAHRARIPNLPELRRIAELRSAAQFVAQVAIRRSITLFVEIHASRYRNLFLLPKHGAGLRFTVTSRALGFGFQVSLMALEDILAYINSICVQDLTAPLPLTGQSVGEMAA